MNLEFLILGGYGQFVWPAFVFTFVCCFVLYIKTKKEFQTQEKKFLKVLDKTQLRKNLSQFLEKLKIGLLYF